MVDAVEVWVCSGPRCRDAGGGAVIAMARQEVRGREGVELRERHCFARCELRERPLPALRVDREWVWPATVARLRETLNGVAGAEGK